jgi:ABC-type nickel/cobalt efflux system permease component RcnA
LVDAEGEPVALAMRSFDLVVEDHPRYTFHLGGAIPPAGRLRVRDANYLSSEGTSRLAIRGSGGVLVTGDSLPGDVQQIQIRPTWALSDAEERRTKQIQVEYRPSTPGAADSSHANGIKLDFIPQNSPPTNHLPPTAWRRLLGLGRLSELLDRTQSTGSWLLLLALAIALGAAHAIQPGHGKTLVTAVALGPDIRFSQPALLGLAATAAHTGSVLLIAAVLWCTGVTRVAAVHEVLARSAGFAIGAAGLCRIGRHLGGFSEHDDAAASAGAIKNRGLIGLGLAGGVVPCWDAVALLLLAAAVGKLAAGVELVLAFSLGMAIVLVLVGLAAWKLKSKALGAEAQSRWRRPLAIACGGILAAIGFYLFFQ